MKRPNIVLIICDQMRGDAFGAAGNPFIRTPNIDALAARGAVFSRAYSAVPSCLPARAILWSGQNQWHAGVLGMGPGQGQVPNDFPHTLAGELTRAGFRSHMVGKGHFHPQRSLMGFETTELDESGRMPDSDYRQWFRQNAPAGATPDDHGVGWNSWHARPWHLPEHLHPSAWTMSRALAFLATRDRARPFFLNISFARPHSPYVPPQYYFELYSRSHTPPPAVGAWAHIHECRGEFPQPNAWHGKMTDEQIHLARAGYYGEISFIDTQIGRLLNWFEDDWDTYLNTWFLFISDHGDMQGDHNLWRKTYAYEGSIRIPFILVPPLALGKPAHRVIDEIVELRDVMPTLLAAAGLPCPNTVDGRSVLPLLEQNAPAWRQYLHGEHCQCYSRENEMQFIVDKKRKYIWFPRTAAEQFFDLEHDPLELRDLSSTPELRTELEKYRRILGAELAERNCGWAVNGLPHCPDEQPLVSPFRDVRWPGH